MKTALDDCQQHALDAYPCEACGVVIEQNGAMIYMPCRNVAGDPREHFQLSPEDYARAEDAGPVVAIAHSHPGALARPSALDTMACEATALPWWIVSVMAGEDGEPHVEGVECVNPTGTAPPLIGRPFLHGMLDCWTLCRDWYALEYGAALPNPPRMDAWWNDGQSDLYMEHVRAAGFVPIDPATLQRGDLILMQIRAKNLVPNHAGVYLGDGTMLHHLHGRLSTRDVFGGYWLENARSFWRYQPAPPFDLAPPEPATD